MLNYKGSFRVKHKLTNYSDGVFCYSPNGTLFLAKGFHIGEFMPPEPVQVDSAADAPECTLVQEPFSIENKLGESFPIGRFRITGMVFVGESLVVNYTDWYAAGGNQYYTTMVIHNPYDLPNCTIDWQYSMEGIARKSGYMYNVPDEHSDLFGGEIASFAPKESIISRHDLGPSCLGFSLEDLTQTEFSGTVLMDYPFFGKDENGSPRLFYDKSQYSLEATSTPSFSDKYINNVDMPNEIAEHTYNTYWTANSRVAAAFIEDDYLIVVTPMVGGTRKPYYDAELPEAITQGLGYKGAIPKYVYDNAIGEYVANESDRGYGPAIADDCYTSVFTFELSELQNVRDGLIEPHEVRPIKQELHKQPVANTLRDGIHAVPRHGAYRDGLITLSYDNEVRVGNYDQTPLFNVFSLSDSEDSQVEVIKDSYTLEIEVSKEIHDMLAGKKLKINVV